MKKSIKAKPFPTLEKARNAVSSFLTPLPNLYYIDENLKAVKKFPAKNEESRFKIQFKRNLSLTKH